MSSLEEVKTAGKRMREAQAALLAYAERKESDALNMDKHRQLANELTEATQAYIRLVLALNVKKAALSAPLTKLTRRADAWLRRHDANPFTFEEANVATQKTYTSYADPCHQLNRLAGLTPRASASPCLRYAHAR